MIHIINKYPVVSITNHVQLGPKVFGQTYFKYKKYNTILRRFRFIQNMIAQRLLVTIIHYITIMYIVYIILEQVIYI